MDNIFVSVVCPTYNRHYFLPSLIERFQFQIYPKELLELIILDDSNIKYYDLELFQKDDRITYIYENKKLNLGEKRNKLNKIAKGDIIICMDDDDYYSPYYIMDTVKLLSNSTREIASCNALYIYNVFNKTISCLKSCKSEFTIRNATFACKKKYLLNHNYKNNTNQGEELDITNNLTIPVARSSVYFIIVINHGNNTVSYNGLKSENIDLDVLLLTGCKNNQKLFVEAKKIFENLIIANEGKINKENIQTIQIKQYYKDINEKKQIISKLKYNSLELQNNFIGTLTTTQLRINKINNVIQSIINQKYKVNNLYINIPNFDCIQKEVYLIPPSIYKLLPNIIIYRCNDYGPLTKLIPILKKTSINDDFWIITFDDDTFYEEEQTNYIDLYIKNYNYNKNLVFGFIGFDFDKNYDIVYKSEEKCVDILEGYGSIAYHRSIFKDDFIDYLNKLITNNNCKYSDDILISNYLAKHNINRLQMYSDNFNKDKSIEKKYIFKYSNYNDSLKNGKNGLIFNKIDRYKRVIQILKDKNLYYL